MRLKIFLIPAICLLLFGCATTSKSNKVIADPESYAFVGILKHSTAIQNFARVPSLLYCQYQRWPTTEEVTSYQYPDDNPTQFINNLQTSIDDQNRFNMQFELVTPPNVTFNNNRKPTVNITIPQNPSKWACKLNKINFKNVQMMIQVPDKSDK